MDAKVDGQEGACLVVSWRTHHLSPKKPNYPCLPPPAARLDRHMELMPKAIRDRVVTEVLQVGWEHANRNMQLRWRLGPGFLMKGCWTSRCNIDVHSFLQEERRHLSRRMDKYRSVDESVN